MGVKRGVTALPSTSRVVSLLPLSNLSILLQLLRLAYLKLSAVGPESSHACKKALRPNRFLPGPPPLLHTSLRIQSVYVFQLARIIASRAGRPPCVASAAEAPSTPATSGWR